MLVAHLTLQREKKEPIDLGVIGVSEASATDATIANFKVTCSLITGEKIRAEVKGFARTGGYYNLMARALEEVQTIMKQQLESEKKQLESQTYPNFCTAQRSIEGANYTKQCGEPALPNTTYCSDHTQ